MGVLSRTEYAWAIQCGHLFPWVPVCLALGIGVYFLLLFEPLLWVYALCGALAAVLAGYAAVRQSLWSPLPIAVALVLAGFCLAGGRAHLVAGPVLDWRYYGPVEGRVVAIDRSTSDALRITLDQVRLTRVAPDDTPHRVRLSLHGDAVGMSIPPGARVMTTGHLSPPQGPAEPGGFDFRRHAWFQALGAVGYVRVPVLTVAPPQGASLWVFQLRDAASRYIRSVMPGDAGGFAAAVTTGDRSGVSQEALRNLRDSNLAHLLAISGLHMGLLAGFVFAFLRLVMAAIPGVALRWPIKKIAALGALIAAGFYLMLSGGNVATERAFIMAAVVLFAVMLDRRALTLRAVAVAALIVLILRPEALLSPGFQMSFAATTALVAVFGTLETIRMPRWLRPSFWLFVSSAVAGAATAPVAAAHFNMLAQFGLIANLVSVPLMGVLVIPAAVVLFCLAPFGLAFAPLWVMGIGLQWILSVAAWVAQSDGAVRAIAVPAPLALPLMALSALWLILWQGRARFAGVAGIAVAFAVWGHQPRPGVLIAESGTLVGVMTEEGRALSRARGSGFVARVWLENDGDRVAQPVAADRWEDAAGRIRHLHFQETEIVHVSGKNAASQFKSCDANQIVVASVALPLRGPCTVYDPVRLRQTGSIAVRAGRIETAAALSGQRLWTLVSR
ncbi:MAG: ComEC/Rec2 family competence protein [Rhodobacteraceae bacterium]|nr:ComEC/Rec2 family competence protein [Paracoccaceae bacterium]